MKNPLLVEINRTREIMGLTSLTESKDQISNSVLNEDWWGRLWGGKKRREDIYNILKSGVEWKETDAWIDASDRKKTPPVYSESELRVFSRIVNKLDRIFVDESSVIEYLKDEAKYMGLDELNTLTQIAFKDSKAETKPEKFVDLLVLSGNFDEGEKYSLDKHLDTTLSQLKQEQLALREKDKVCPWAATKGGIYEPGENPENPYNKETEEDIWKWCEAKREAYDRSNVKSVSDYGGPIWGETEENTGTKEDPFRGTPRVDEAEEGKYYRNSRNEKLYLVKDGKYVEIIEVDKVEESHHLNEINRVREIMGLKPLMEQQDKKGDVVTRNGKKVRIVDLISTELKPINIGQKFKSAVYKLKDESLDAVEDLSKKMVTFFSVPDLKGITFEIVLEGGASLVPIQDEKAKEMGMPGWETKDAKERNIWLAQKRTQVVKTYLENALTQAGIDNVTIPKPILTLGTVPWDRNKGADHDDYTKAQKMNISFKATGIQEVLEALPSFCKSKFPQKTGKQGVSPNYTIYPGDGMELNLGEGKGMITLTFDAWQVPDKFILTYNDKEYVSSNALTGVEGFVSNIFKPLTQKQIDAVPAKLKAAQERVTELTDQIEEVKSIIAAGEEEQKQKLIKRLEQEEANLELAIKTINEKIKKYGYSIPLEMGWAGKYAKQGKKWGPYIEHFFDYPNRTVPNVYWFEHKDDEERLVTGETLQGVKESEYLRNAFYNLNKEGELDEKWFTDFFQLYLYDRNVEKSDGYKRLVKNRGKTGFKKDDILEFFITMKKLQKRQLNDQEKALENMKAEIPAKKKEIQQRKVQVEKTLKHELELLVGEERILEAKITNLLEKANITKAEYDYNMRTKGGYSPGTGYMSTAEYNTALKDAGFDDGIIGPNGQITFDKIMGENKAWLQVVAPLGGTRWDVDVKCGKSAAQTETKST